MKQNIEIEYKSLLSPFDFKRLLNSFFKDAAVFIQKNTYYDTVDKDYFQLKSVIRIREIQNRFLFTLKQLNEQGHVLEYEIEDSYLEINDARITSLLNQLGLPTDLLILSRSLTHRYLIVDSGGEWCLDLNEFKHHVDFELEYELNANHKEDLQRFLNFLESYSIPYHHADSKFIRSLR